MFTIALDEQGDFENLNNKLNTEPVFIGGILYDDCGDSDDYDTEKRRLQSYELSSKQPNVQREMLFAYSDLC